MSENGIRSRVSKKFKATTNSNHKFAVAKNILNRDFSTNKPNEKMTKELVINALNDAYTRAGKPSGFILHSDRGSQYCSHDYQYLIKKYGFTCSMSRKGNCWDNAPMEWIYGKHFKTRDEARAAVFEYVEIFYDRQRVHASNGYLTPEEFYNRAIKKLHAA